ncbi:unnamed protein product, partial [marine sediment metagenome]
GIIKIVCAKAIPGMVNRSPNSPNGPLDEISAYTKRTITTAITLETGKGDFAMGVALGIVLLVLALAVNWALIILKRKSQQRF